jgi:hypothetical protein
VALGASSTIRETDETAIIGIHKSGESDLSSAPPSSAIRARVALKHLDGNLRIVPRPSITGERRAEIGGRAKSDSLLRDPTARRFHPRGEGAPRQLAR